MQKQVVMNSRVRTSCQWVFMATILLSPSLQAGGLPDTLQRAKPYPKATPETAEKLRSTATPTASRHGSKAWLQEPVYLGWMTEDRIVPKDYAARQAEKAQKLGAKIYLYEIQVGGPVIYRSKLTLMPEHLDRDLLAEMIQECHARGIKFIAGWLGTLPANALQVREHPDWLQRPPVAPSHDHEAPFGQFVCYNSPIREFRFAQVREVLSHYQVDGVYFDDLPGVCFCNYCREQFMDAFGYPMPISKEGYYESGAGNFAVDGYDSPVNRFGRMKKRAFLWNVRQIIDSTRPESALIVNGLYAEEGLESGGEYVDALLPEVDASSSLNCMDFSATERLTSLYCNAPTWGLTKYDKRRVGCEPIAHVLAVMADSTATVEPIVIRDQDCLDLEAPTTAETVYLTMRELTGIYHELRSATPLDYAVLLHSSNSTRVAEDETRTSFLGMHRFLIEQHIPYRIETEQTLQQKGLGGAKVLVLPNTAHLAPETVGLIEKFVEQGGGVLATALTGGLDLQGTFTPPGQLGKLLGVEMMNLVNERHYDFSPQGEVPIPSQHPSDYFFGRFGSEDHPLIPRELKGALFDWDGYLVEVSADASSQIVAWALDYDQALINTHYFDRRIPYPGEKRLPLVVARKFGKGRTVYVAAPICQSGVRSGSDELTALLQRTILWAAGGEPPVQAAGAPMRLRITPRQADGTLLVFFNNLHTVESPYVRRERVPGTRSDKSTKRYETMQGRIVGLAPIPGFELRWDTGGRTVGAVEDQKGRALDFHQEGHWVVVNVPRLNTYLLVRLHLK